MTNAEIDKLADAILNKLLEHWKKEENQQHHYVVTDEFGNSRNVTEYEYLQYELHKLEQLEKRYAKNEEFEKANIIKNKINRLVNKIKKL